MNGSTIVIADQRRTQVTVNASGATITKPTEVPASSSSPGSSSSWPGTQNADGTVTATQVQATNTAAAERAGRDAHPRDDRRLIGEGAPRMKIQPALAALGAVGVLALAGFGGGSANTAAAAGGGASSATTATTTAQGQGGGANRFNDPAVQECLAALA